MKTKKIREIIIEFERERMIYKRGKRKTFFCRDCAGETEFLTVAEAAALLEIAAADIFRRIENGSLHAEITTGGARLVCLDSALLNERRFN